MTPDRTLSPPRHSSNWTEIGAVRLAVLATRRQAHGDGGRVPPVPRVDRAIGSVGSNPGHSIDLDSRRRSWEPIRSPRPRHGGVRGLAHEARRPNHTLSPTPRLRRLSPNPSSGSALNRSAPEKRGPSWRQVCFCCADGGSILKVHRRDL